MLNKFMNERQQIHIPYCNFQGTWTLTIQIATGIACARSLQVAYLYQIMVPQAQHRLVVEVFILLLFRGCVLIYTNTRVGGPMFQEQ